MKRPGHADATLLTAIARAYGLLWQFARGRRQALSGAAALLLGAELLRLALPWLAGEAVNAIQREGTQGVAQAGRLLAGFFGVVALAWVGHAGGRYLERNVGLHARRAMALELLTCLLRTPLAWHRREHPLEMAQRTMQGTESLNEFAQTQYVYLQSIVQIVGPVAALWLIAPALGLAAALGLVLLGAVSLGFDRILLRLSDQRNAADRRNHAAWGVLLGSMIIVRALRLYPGARALASRRLEAVFVPLRKEVVVNELKWGAVELLGTLFWIALVGLHMLHASAAAGTGVVALGTVFMVYEYARRAEACVANFAADFGGLAHHVSGIRVVAPLLHAPQTPEPAGLAPSAWKRLELQGLGFDHGEGAPPALRGVHLTLERGRHYALVGSSGAGKTALLTVLSGLESGGAGQLLMDGRQIGVNELRRESTFLPTDGAPMDGTLREILAPAGGHDDAALWEALARAELLGPARALPNGLDSSLGDGHSRWSAGEQQRLALARGLLASRGTSLLLGDEPTSHLDPCTAARVMAALLELHDSACIVVALHDTALASMFDAVILMEAGNVVAGPLATTMNANKTDPALPRERDPAVWEPRSHAG